MPWLRSGDTSATHPLLMALVSVFHSDERTMNEVAGFVWRCATQSTAHMTDYRVDLGTAVLMGNGRHELLLQQACEAGLLIQHGEGRERSWTIVEDPEFIHMPSRAEVMWKRQRDRDARDEALTVPVRHRDGDECRFCGRIVNWRDRKGIKGGTYDHLEPGRAATVATYVVACGGCNRALSDLDTEERAKQLRPAPLTPFYSPHTAEWLAKRGIDVTPTTAQSESARAAAPRPESSSDHRDAPSSRPQDQDTAVQHRPGATAPDTEARQRGESTDKPTAVVARDSGLGHRRAPGSDPTPGWTPQPRQRPDFLSDTAAPTEAPPGGHAPGPTPPHPMDESPPGRRIYPRPTDPDRSDVSKPGRVGTGRVGPGAARLSPDLDLPANPAPLQPHAPQQPRRGKRKRARKSKKG